MTVGARILAARKEKGLSQSDLVCEGVSESLISLAEKGKRNISVTAIRKIAAKLGVDAIWLETGDRSCEITILCAADLASAIGVLERQGYGPPCEIRVTELAPDDPRLA